MFQWIAKLFGFVDEEEVKRRIDDLRKELIAENEERLLEEKWKRSEQRDQIDLLRSRINDMERREIQAARTAQRQAATASQHAPTFTFVPGTNQQQWPPTARVPVARRQSSSPQDETRARSNASQNAKTTTKTELPKKM